MKDAKRLFEEAIAEDDGYAEAYVGLADAFFLLGNYHHLPMAEATAKGKEALARACRWTMAWQRRTRPSRTTW